MKKENKEYISKKFNTIDDIAEFLNNNKEYTVIYINDESPNFLPRYAALFEK